MGSNTREPQERKAGILIVDDSEQMRTLTRAMLAEGGFDNTICAGSAAEACRLLGIGSGNACGEGTDLILMDVLMPETSGIEACRLIREDLRFRETPIIMLTAAQDDELLGQAFDAGASDYIRKPVRNLELRARIEAALRLKAETDRRKEKEERLAELAEELGRANSEKDRILDELYSAIDEITAKNFSLEKEIAERKKTEEELLSYKRAVHNMQIGVTITDSAGRITYVNPAEADMHQYGQEELIGQDVRIFAPKTLWNPMEKKALRSAASFRRESINLRKDGSVFPVQLLSDVVLNDKGEPVAVVTTSEDITERKSYETALQAAHDTLEGKVAERTKELTVANASIRQSENRYRTLYQQFDTLVNVIPDSLILFARDNSILWHNRGAFSILGMEESDLRGKMCPFIPLLYDGEEDWPVRRAFISGHAESGEKATGDGKRLRIRAFPILSGKGKVESVLELLSDETEKTRLQAEAMRAGHLASIGELSAGIAHEINNPTNGIINCAELLLKHGSASGKTRELAELVLSEGKRIARIVQALLSFARKRGEKKMPVRLKTVLDDSLALTEAHLRKDGILLDIDFPDGLPEIMGNDQQIEQVFLNLINNARYALNARYPGKDPHKRFGIRAGCVSDGEQDSVRISFRDGGTGIPPKIIGRVLDPFFSTKPPNEGTGLGLSISHGIVADHGGRLVIDSKEGEYTDICVILPAGGKQ